MILRDPIFQEVSTIKELVEYFDCLEDNEISFAVKKLKQSNGEGVVFLFDSLEEYPGVLKNQFIVNLLYRKILSKSIIVITSRPTVSLSLHDKVEKRVKILGFGSTECNEYITKSLEVSPERKEYLEKYLKQHPLLNCIIYVPFHLSVLLFIFDIGGLPKTLTELIEFFILHTILLNLDETHGLLSAEKFSDFPKPVNDIVEKLIKLAFYGLQNSRLVFSDSEIKQFCPEIEKAINGYGLLQTVQHYPTKGGAGSTVSYSFLHATIQEFLAASYLSRCSTTTQVGLLKQSFTEVDTTTPEDISHALMWYMYFEIVEADANAWTQFTSEHDYSPSNCGRCYHFNCQFDERVKEVCTTSFRNSKINILFFVVLPYHIATLCISKLESPQKWKNTNQFR